MITVHLDTLQSKLETYDSRSGPVTFERQTIEISIGNDRRRVNCHQSRDCIDLYGLAVRFRTGAKVWPASAVYWLKSGNVNNLRPMIDKFNGQFCQLLGYFEDHEQSKHRSQHNAVA